MSIVDILLRIQLIEHFHAHTPNTSSHSLRVDGWFVQVQSVLDPVTNAQVRTLDVVHGPEVVEVLVDVSELDLALLRDVDHQLDRRVRIIEETRVDVEFRIGERGGLQLFRLNFRTGIREIGRFRSLDVCRVFIVPNSQIWWIFFNTSVKVHLKTM